jgi:hypothetical protein
MLKLKMLQRKVKKNILKDREMKRRRSKKVAKCLMS